MDDVTLYEGRVWIEFEAAYRRYVELHVLTKPTKACRSKEDVKSARRALREIGNYRILLLVFRNTQRCRRLNKPRVLSVSMLGKILWTSEFEVRTHAAPAKKKKKVLGTLSEKTFTSQAERFLYHCETYALINRVRINGNLSHIEATERLDEMCHKLAQALEEIRSRLFIEHFIQGLDDFSDIDFDEDCDESDLDNDGLDDGAPKDGDGDE